MAHLSPLGWEHINLICDHLWRSIVGGQIVSLGSGKYLRLRG
jgi:hypothetical protein